MLTDARKLEIKNIVLPLLNKELSGIATENNIDVIVADISSIKNASGVLYYKKSDDKYKIYIHDKDVSTRQRFTFAHELGHYFLHKDYLLKYTMFVDDKLLFRAVIPENSELAIMEEEANCFAVELLMPESMILDAWEVTDDVNKLVKIFNVSLLAMAYRLENLGLTSNK